jgi:membrane-associated phospholipid phosphatase
MAWSRMYNGMHYPSDIFVWTIIWIGCGWLGVVLSKKVFRLKKFPFDNRD